MKFIKWLTDLTRDERGNISVKPVIAMMGAIFLCVTMAINSFSHKEIEPSTSLIDAVIIITTIGMGADSLDKFSFKGKSAEKKPEPEKTPTDPEV